MYPTCPLKCTNKTVFKDEKRLKHHLSKECLGTPLVCDFCKVAVDRTQLAQHECDSKLLKEQMRKQNQLLKQKDTTILKLREAGAGITFNSMLRRQAE